jgi:hypothetical protein
VTLAEQLLAVDESLDGAGLPHAFGGAIALAYWTLEPRGTRDLDVNVFVDAEHAERALSALPQGVRWGAADLQRALREGQVRVWWDETPLDLFFDYAPIHKDAAAYRRLVPFAGREIPVLGPVELVVFKVMFDRTRDWADIEAVFTAGTADVDAVRSALRPMLAAEDHRWARLEEALRRAAESSGGT